MGYIFDSAKSEFSNVWYEYLCKSQIRKSFSIGRPRWATVVSRDGVTISWKKNIAWKAQTIRRGGVGELIPVNVYSITVLRWIYIWIPLYPPPPQTVTCSPFLFPCFTFVWPQRRGKYRYRQGVSLKNLWVLAYSCLKMFVMSRPNSCLGMFLTLVV